jgi:hypothetical protein
MVSVRSNDLPHFSHRYWYVGTSVLHDAGSSPVGMAGRYTGSYLGRSYGWRTVAILADIGQASLIECIPDSIYAWCRMVATS